METLSPGSDIVRTSDPPECVESFEWRTLHFHVVTRDPLTPEQVRQLRKTLSKIDRVGLFAELIAMILGRHVQIRTVRPSADIRFEVG